MKTDSPFQPGVGFQYFTRPKIPAAEKGSLDSRRRATVCLLHWKCRCVYCEGRSTSFFKYLLLLLLLAIEEISDLFFSELHVDLCFFDAECSIDIAGEVLSQRGWHSASDVIKESDNTWQSSMITSSPLPVALTFVAYLWWSDKVNVFWSVLGRYLIPTRRHWQARFFSVGSGEVRKTAVHINVTRNLIRFFASSDNLNDFSFSNSSWMSRVTREAMHPIPPE